LKKEKIYLSLTYIDEFVSSSLIDDEYTSGFSDLNRKKESIVARLELNRLCEKYFNNSLKAFSFNKDAYGKPSMNNMNCSISHSKGWVFVGIGNLPFGLDIEQFKEDECEHLRLTFSDNEWDKIQNDTLKIFFEFSLKESVAKQLGKGFLIEPSQIQIPQNCFKLKWLMTIGESIFVLTFFAEIDTEIVFDKINISCKLVSYNENN
jgi:phosphopantetheinyl transferase